MNNLDTLPPEEHGSASIDVLLVYADGRTCRGYRSGWQGWMRYEGWMPEPVEDDAEQPIGWRLP